MHLVVAHRRQYIFASSPLLLGNKISLVKSRLAWFYSSAVADRINTRDTNEPCRNMARSRFAQTSSRFFGAFRTRLSLWRTRYEASAHKIVVIPNCKLLRLPSQCEFCVLSRSSMQDDPLVLNKILVL